MIVDAGCTLAANNPEWHSLSVPESSPSRHQNDEDGYREIARLYWSARHQISNITRGNSSEASDNTYSWESTVIRRFKFKLKALHLQM
ncbi:hypothetical protein J6590_091706 [Homalodisca vitripennis]|nr:hypothetical protein J6590_091706 [Homalodisca vitripennis]